MNITEGRAMTDEKPISELRVIMRVVGLSYTEIAPVIGTSPSTVRFALESGRVPDRSETRLKFFRFVERNRDARSRADLRFV